MGAVWQNRKDKEREKELEAHRRAQTALRGQQQKCSINPLPSTLSMSAVHLHKHMCAHRQNHTFWRGTWESSLTWGNKATGKQRHKRAQTSISDIRRQVWQAENMMVFYQSAECPENVPQRFRAISQFLCSSPFIALSICCSLREKPYDFNSPIYSFFIIFKPGSGQADKKLILSLEYSMCALSQGLELLWGDYATTGYRNGSENGQRIAWQTQTTNLWYTLNEVLSFCCYNHCAENLCHTNAEVIHNYLLKDVNT